uniref:Putative ribonuclease H-like domain-containing protein n=1 Tax=Tanacetum cinerariifolium TaxID=118510 RepID=A0A6L2M3H7_TANCI|nr:putative ribonuclease H-like domain-containing protein [Tanacetum cinerariifolium]
MERPILYVYLTSFNTASPSDTVVSPKFEIAGKSSIVDPFNYPDDLDMPELEDIVCSDDEEDVGAEADLSNLEKNISVSPIPTTRVHKDHPVTQIIGELTSAPQTRSMTRMVKEQGGLHQINDEDFHTCMFTCFLSQEEPKKVHQTLKDPSWIEAMQEELLQFKMQKVWVLVDLPKGKRAICSKWVFRNKKDERRIVIKNKARLVAQGHTQEEGIDYDEVFAPVAKIEAIRLFLAYASFIGFMVYQMDVKSANLYGTIEEEVYVCQPLGFENPDYPDKVYKVVKALHGLHQAPRVCYETLANYLLKNGLQVMQKDDGIFISQDKYVAEILRKFGFRYVKSASTPIKTEKPLLKDPDGEDVDVHIYSKELASLKQTALGKDKSNPFMAGSLPKTIWHFITAVSYKLMMFGLTKDDAVNLMLLGFDQIVDFLNAHVIEYALVVNPTIYVSCIKQFWATAMVTDIKENDKIKAKTGQNQAQNRKREKVNQVKVKVKPVKTGHGFGKNTKNQSRRRKYLIGLTRTRVNGPRGNILINETCSKCNSGAENSFTYDPNPESFNEVQSIFNPPPQSHYKIYLCQLCESNSHYGYECSQRVPLVYEPEPCYNQNFGDNDYSHDSPGVTPLIDHHCCYKCGDTLDDFFCHQCTCEFCGNGAHDGYNCPSHIAFIQTLPSFPQQYTCCEDCGGPHDTFQCQPMNYFEFSPCYDSNYCGPDQIKPSQYSVNQPLNIQNELDDHELFINELIQQKLQNEYAQPFPAIAITFDLPTVEPEDSLRIGDEHLDTIPKTESDEFIKSSVKNLVPNPSESEDLSDSECDVPACDDFTTFSNLLFDANDDFSSSDNESFSDEDISKEIYSNPLFNEEIISIKIDPHHFNDESDLIESLLNHDSLIISSSSKIDFVLDEFARELILLKSIPPGIDETDCDPEEEIRFIEKLLYDNSSPRPPKEFISENYDAAIQSFSPSPIPIEDSDSLMEEIDLTLTLDDSMPPGIENDDYDSEGDILIREEMLSNNSLPENESFHYDIPLSPRPPTKPPDDEIKPNSGILIVKVVVDISKNYVLVPRLLPTQPTHDSNQEKSPHLLSHRGLKAFQLSSESPMMIYEGNTPILDATIKKANDVVQLRALIDGKKVVVTEDVVRQDLHLDDVDGVECLPNEEIFAELTRMGYKKPPPKLTFYKPFFSAQWKFLIHTLVRCLSTKWTAWNEFSCSMASAVICLAIGRKFNFSKYISDIMVRNVDNPSKFFIVEKGFSRVETPLFATMLVQPQPQATKAEEEVEVPTAPTPLSTTNAPSPHAPQDPTLTPHALPHASSPQEQPSSTTDSSMSLLHTLMETYATLSNKVAKLEQDKHTQALEILKLTKRVKKLEKKKKSRSSGFKRLRKIGGKIEAINADGDITLVEVDTQVDTDAELHGRIDQDTLIKMKEEKAKLLDEQLAQRLHDKEVKKATAREKQEKDDLERAEVLQQQYDDKEENIDWSTIAEQIQEKHLDNIMKYQSLKRKPVSIAQTRKNMIIYLKNMAGYKMEHFISMTYDKVRPIFKKEYKKVQTLFKPDKDVEKPKKKRVVKETLLQESFKKLKAVEVLGFESTQETPTSDPKEMSEEDVQNMLEIIPMSKFKVEALQVKYPIIDWEIHSDGSRSYWKIIRDGGITKAY